MPSDPSDPQRSFIEIGNASIILDNGFVIKDSGATQKPASGTHYPGVTVAPIEAVHAKLPKDLPEEIKGRSAKPKREKKRQPEKVDKKLIAQPRSHMSGSISAARWSAGKKRQPGRRRRESVRRRW